MGDDRGADANRGADVKRRIANLKARAKAVVERGADAPGLIEEVERIEVECDELENRGERLMEAAVNSSGVRESGVRDRLAMGNWMVGLSTAGFALVTAGIGRWDVAEFPELMRAGIALLWVFLASGLAGGLGKVWLHRELAKGREAHYLWMGVRADGFLQTDGRKALDDDRKIERRAAFFRVLGNLCLVAQAVLVLGGYSGIVLVITKLVEVRVATGAS